MAQFKKTQSLVHFAAKTAKRTVHSAECSDINVLHAENNFKINDVITSARYSGVNTRVITLPSPCLFVATV